VDKVGLMIPWLGLAVLAVLVTGVGLFVIRRINR